VNPHHKPSLKPIQTRKNLVASPRTNVKETNIKPSVVEHHRNTTQTITPTTRSIKIPDRHRDRQPKPRRAHPSPDRRRDRQPKPRRAHPSLDRRLSVNPKPRHVLPKLLMLFLLWRTERERRTEGEQRKKN
jgi:hypothetical protein